MIQLRRLRPPAIMLMLSHDEKVEPAIVVEVAGDNVVDLGRRGKGDR